MIVSESLREGIDLEYEFGHVAIDSEQIDYNGNCGNLSAAVPIYALFQGLAKQESSRQLFRMYQRNIQ